MQFEPVSVELQTVGGLPMKVHLFSTGAVAVKRRFQQARLSGLPAVVDYLLDRRFTPWLPIWVLVIEHPEGIFVIDTGENSDINQPAYFSPAGRFGKWFNTSQFKFQVDRNEEIDQQMIAAQLSPANVKMVVLTHLHLDHVDGLRHFNSVPVVVNRREWERPYGDLPFLYPEGFKPRLVDMEERFDLFERVSFLTDSNDLMLIETPGHTWHHCSVLLQTNDCGIFFAADLCYTQEQLVSNQFAGAHASRRLSVASYGALRSYASRRPVVLIPSHDPGAAARLRHLQPISIPHHQ